jgi:hypothetical protein
MNNRNPATYDGLTDALKFSPPHLRPIIESVRDGDCAMLFVGQTAQAFRAPRNSRQPVIFMIGDDFDAAVGPEHYHMPSLRRAMRACKSFALVSSCPQPAVYASIALTATLSRENVMLIETRPEMEIPWLEMIQKTAPRRFIWLATVNGGHA